MGKAILYSVLGVVGVLGIVFLMGLYGLGMDSFFRPKYENIKRKTFENTQSYVHGNTKRLSKLFKEYQDTDSLDEKEIIEDTIRHEFAEFDATKLNSSKLRRFLEKSRGY